jgi:hypothetical protein
VTFKNYDGSELESKQWEDGSTPSYSGATPSRPSDAQYSYVFKGWSPEIAAVSAAAEYQAEYFSIPLSAQSIVFTADTNKLSAGKFTGTDVYDGSGSAVASSGSEFSFSYNSFYNPAGAWQTIKNNGYFTNLDPIYGMASIQLTKANASSSLQVYWSATTTFSDTRSATYDSTSELTFTCDFDGFYPNYIKVVALGSGDSSISSAAIIFSSHTLGSSFALGKYPQTLVEDSTLLTALASATDTDSDGYLEYGSDEYKKVDSATPCDTGYKSASGNTTFVAGTAYYFKVEPIEWRVLSGKGTATGLVMSEKILDTNPYYTSHDTRTISGSSVYANNYQYSTLRAALNGLDGSAYSVANFSGKGFLDVAFTAAEKANITTTKVDNSAATALANTAQPTLDFTSANTDDKIFALSYQDLLNTNYGFGTSTTSLASRGAVLTDYGRATGGVMSSYGNGYWWSRSPYAASKNYYCISRVGFGGDVAYGGASLSSTSVTPPSVGIRPSFTVNLG